MEIRVNSLIQETRLPVPLLQMDSPNEDNEIFNSTWSESALGKAFAGV